MIAKEYNEIINKGYTEIFTGLSDKLKEQLEENEHEIVLSGCIYSYPDWFIRKKATYTALCDALSKCEEFINDIK